MAPARDWRKLLAEPAGDAIVVIEGGPEASADVEKAAAALGLYAVRLDGPEASDKKTLLASISRKLSFPAYFGGNWDALKDCLTDLAEWVAAPGWVVTVSSAESLCAHSPIDRQAFLDVMREAAAFWRAQVPPRPLRLVLVQDARK
ncbi:MAG: barstar family protein [Elusimicrobia bacterium]|nr:barstar family protein [Elusimicrobiota bacterium]